MFALPHAKAIRVMAFRPGGRGYTQIRARTHVARVAAVNKIGNDNDPTLIEEIPLNCNGSCHAQRLQYRTTLASGAKVCGIDAAPNLARIAFTLTRGRIG